VILISGQGLHGQVMFSGALPRPQAGQSQPVCCTVPPVTGVVVVMGGSCSALVCSDRIAAAISSRVMFSTSRAN
jgi:hypothetical protein